VPRDRVRLPDGIQACLFDMDGVLTDTATLHAAAYKQAFDEFLRRSGEPFRPFDAVTDYEEYVDGMPRPDAVRSFLASRGITADAETLAGLGDRSNQAFLRLLRSRRMEAFPGSVRFVRAVRSAGLRAAVVSSSANSREVLEAAAITDLFDVRVDGVTIEREHLDGKPAPDAFLAAARELGTEPAAAAVFEDALAGVAAGRAGRFGFVVGVDRAGRAAALYARGADIVVSDLGALLTRA
jgi:beta-phosphoglucomutase family hydrolase